MNSYSKIIFLYDFINITIVFDISVKLWICLVVLKTQTSKCKRYICPTIDFGCDASFFKESLEKFRSQMLYFEVNLKTLKDKPNISVQSAE